MCKTMNDDLKYPRVEAVRSILTKIGVDPSSRFDALDQDYEYTTCKLEELELYADLYERPDTSVYEKRVLGCYFLECLNEFSQMNNCEHLIQNKVLRLIHSDIEIHATELAYWSDTSDADQENWWPITKSLISWKYT